MGKFFVFLIFWSLTIPVYAINEVYGVVATKSTALNIRAGMGTDMRIIHRVPKGTKIRILAIFGSWYKVKLNNGKIGYASSDYIKILDNKVSDIVIKSGNSSYSFYIDKGNLFNETENIKAAYRNYLKAFQNASTLKERTHSLGSLAVTASKLGKTKEVQKYLQSLFWMAPENQWVRNFAQQQHLTNLLIPGRALETVLNFLKWYVRNRQAISEIESEMVNQFPPNIRLPDNPQKLPYSVNLAATERYLSYLKHSGTISDKYIQTWRTYFKKCDDYLKEHPQYDGAPEGFEFDFITFSQEYTGEDIIEHPTLILWEGLENSATVKIEFVEHPTTKTSSWGLTFKLSRYETPSGNQWLIDNIDHSSELDLIWSEE